jgi:hypothetical protein
MPLSKPFRGIQFNRIHPLAQDLVGWWLANEGCGVKLFDYTRQTKPANVSFFGNTSWAGGKFGPALNFDGTDDYVYINPVVNFNNVNAGTYSFWLYYRTSVNNDGFLVAANVQPLSYNSSGNFRVNIYASGGVAYSVTAGAIPLNSWTHYLVTYDTTVCKVYRNGVYVAQDLTPTYTLDLITSSLYLGTDRGTASRDIDGMMDDVRCWNRALAAAEVAWLYREPFAMFDPGIRRAILDAV